jgi:hypothetical protein
VTNLLRTEETGQRYIIVSSDVHAGPSLETSLRPHWPATYLEQFDDFVKAVRSGALARDERDAELNHVDHMLVFGLDETALRAIANVIGPLPSEVDRELAPSHFPEHRGCAFRQFNDTD